MPRPKGFPKTGGRKKGVGNRDTAELREMTSEALRRKGGVKYLVWLAEAHPAIFGRLLAKLIPQAIEAKVEGDNLPLVVRRDFAGGAYARNDDPPNDLPATSPRAQ